MGNGMRFSYCMLPDYPMADMIDMIKTADELGFYACYSVDETWHKDLCVLFAAAADKTERIRFGPNVTHVFLREPTLICQQIATLDELTGGRTELVVSTGNFGLCTSTGSTGPARSRCRASRRRSTSCARSSTRARSRSRATSSATAACTRSPARCRSGSRSRWAA